jgi:hypothetical protein
MVNSNRIDRMPAPLRRPYTVASSEEAYDQSSGPAPERT